MATEPNEDQQAAQDDMPVPLAPGEDDWLGENGAAVVSEENGVLTLSAEMEFETADDMQAAVERAEDYLSDEGMEQQGFPDAAGGDGG